MGMIDGIIGELKHEAQSTRKLLERVPEEQFDWRPHPKSMSLRELASHIVDSFAWVSSMVDLDIFEMDPSTYKPFSAANHADLVGSFDKNLAQTMETLTGLSDERLLQDWTMKVGGQTVLTLPRVAVIKTFTLNHMIHHRGQLDVYLRMQDVPLPQIYGPTADEPDMVPQAT